MEKFFSPCPRGLEVVLAAELTELGAQYVRNTDGGVHFSGDFTLCYRINLESRIASRVLWQVAHGHHRNEEDIYRAALALPWHEWFDVAMTIRVKMTAIKSQFRSIDFVTLRVKDAICDRFREQLGVRPSVDTQQPDMRIHVFLTESEYMLYLDTSDESLFKRGYRKEANEAPLRENLAAGILKLSGWIPGTPLLDPMCGSGTFLIEAVLMSLNIAPGSSRHFAFEKLHNFDQARWEAIRDAAIAAQKELTPLPIYGSDLYGEALDAARYNLAAAGFEGLVNLKQANILEISAPAEEGVLVTNPPYGVRLGEQSELAELYPKLGDLLKQKFAGWRAYIFTADAQLPKLIRLSASKRTVLFNGQLECRLLEYKVVKGGMRREKPSTA